jgi:pyridoxine 4-dehydrogenase
VDQNAQAGTAPRCGSSAQLLRLAPGVLFVPGTSSVAHLRENLAAARMALDDEALRSLDAVAQRRENRLVD